MDLAEESKYIGEVRGKGLMIGIEIVKDKETKELSKELTAKQFIFLHTTNIIFNLTNNYNLLLSSLK